MLNITGNGSVTTCDGVTRRDFLQVGVLGALGLSLAKLAELQALGAAPAGADEHSCIMIFNLGAPSQIDTFDMKPGRPTGGQFRPIQTNVNGIQICEYMPLMARMIDKLAIVRSMRTHSPDHPDGIYHMHTCYKQSEHTPHPEM